MTRFRFVALLAALLAWSPSAPSRPADEGPQGSEPVRRTAVFSPVVPFEAPPVSTKLDPALRHLVTKKGAVGTLSTAKLTVPQDVHVAVTETGEMLVPCLIRSDDPAETVRQIVDLGGTHRVTAGDIVVAVVRREDLQAVAEWPEVVSVAASYLRKPLLNVSRPSTGADQVFAGSGLPTGYTGKGVIVGIVDTGIDIRHPDFSTPNGTRILAVWDVSGVPVGGQPYTCNATQINAGTCLETDLHGHGTHVAGTAAGNGRAQQGYHGMAPEADIIVAGATRSTTSEGGFDDADIVAACRFVFDHAQGLGRPAVINLSLGGNGGPLDGTSSLERALSSLTGPGRIIVAANGNEGADRIHLSYATAGTSYAESFETLWGQIPSGGIGKIDLWYPSGSISVGIAYRLSADATDPRATTLPVPPGGRVSNQSLLDPGTGLPIAFYSIDAATVSDPNNGHRHVLVELTPVLPGFYSFYTFGSGAFDAWAVNSKFGDKAGGFWRPGDFQKTVGSPASARNLIAVGNHTTKVQWTDVDGLAQNMSGSGWTVGAISPDSSRGPTRDGRTKPELTAPGSWIAAPLSEGALAEWRAPNKRKSILQGEWYLVIQGTSMAAPHVTGAVALMLQANPSLDYAGVLNALQTTASRDSYTSTNPDPNTWGAGKLNVHAAVKAVAGTGPSADFSLSANPSALSVAAGASATTSVTVTPRNGFSSTVSLSASGAPSGISVSFSPTSIAGGSGSSTLSVSTSSSLAAGTYPLTIQATGGGLTRSASLSVAVAQGSAQDFRMQLSPPQVTASPWSAGTTVVTCVPSGGFSSPVALSTTGLVAGASATFSSSSIQCGVSSSVLTISAGSAPIGTHVLAVSGLGGGMSRGAALGLTVQGTAGGSTALFVPVILKSSGANESYYTSEMTLTNRSAQTASVRFSYTATSGGGTGNGTTSLAPGRQLIVPDAIDYLRSRGVPIPAAGNRVGTLRVTFDGVSNGRDVSVIVRTTTPVPPKTPTGAAGLAYTGVPASQLPSGPVLLCGLRRDSLDRTNIAVQNAGDAAAGTVGLRITLISGAPPNGSVVATFASELTPGGFQQFEAPQGFFGWARVERTMGTAPWYAYAVINDNFNSDGSFVLPVPESTLGSTSGLTLPVALEASVYGTEAIFTNLTDQTRRVYLSYYADALGAAPASVYIDMPPKAQYSYENVIAAIRSAGIVVPTGVVGPMFITGEGGSTAGLFVGARTGNPGGGGRYSLFYSAVPFGASTSTQAWISGLQQTSTSRSNLALVNTGEVDGSSSTFRIEIFSGETGAKVGEKTVSVPARRFLQESAILATVAPGTSNAYARITKTSGSNPFIAYGVINDGGQPGQRSGDGAFVLSE